MYSEEDIDSAVDAGILSAQAAAAFRAHVAERQHAPAVDEEHFRLVTGFNDIFVVIACLLLLFSVGWIGRSVVPWMGPLAAAASAWGLAEFFVRRRRMALPAIVLLLAFVANVYGAGYLLFGASTNSAIAASAVAVIAALAHWLRFRVPITVAAGSAAAILLLVSLVLKSVPAARDWISLLLLLAGVAVFAWAMNWDAADTRRQTRRSDVAFWLHMLAAPLLVHPVFTALDVFGGQINLLHAGVVVLLYLGIALLSLAIDRRALMVSALGYVLYTFSTLLKQFGMVSQGFAVTALAIGAALLLLSAFWHPCRAFVLGFFPAGLKRRLPPLH